MLSVFFARFLILLSILLTCEVGAIETVEVDEYTQKVNLSSHSEIFLDNQNYFKYEDVSKELFTDNFVPVDAKSVSIGYTSDVVWMRFAVKNDSKKPFYSKLEIPSPWINTIDVYIKTAEKLDVIKLGSDFKFNTREIDSKSFFVPLVIEPSATANVYIRAEGTNSIIMAPKLYSEKKSFERLGHIATFNGVLIGMILIMFIYHLNRYNVLENKNYLYFSLYLISLLLFMGIFYGYNFQFFWTESPRFNDWVSAVITSFTLFAGLLFSRNFLQTSKNFPKSDKYLYPMMYSFLLLGLLSIVLDSKLLIVYITIVLSVLYSAGLIYISALAVQKKISGSASILSAWFLFAISFVLSTLMMHGFIAYSNLLYDLYGFLLILNVIMLSFALVYRSNDMRILSESIIEKEHDSLYKLTKSKVELQNLNERLEKKIDKQSEKLSNIDKENEKFSIKDKLTNLYNKTKLEELLTNELHRSKRYMDDFSIIVVNIDDLSSINDTHGFQVGSSVIKEMADILIKNIRYIDTVGRWNDNEYMIICPETNADQARTASKHLQKAIEDYKFFFVGNVTVSFGVTASLPTDSGGDIVARAYDALAKAKDNGKNRIEVVQNNSV